MQYVSVELGGICLGTALVCALGWLKTYHRLSARKRLQESQEQASRFLDEERRILELVAKGESLERVLDALTLAIERMSPGCLCSILLLDEEKRCLHEGAGGSLPREYMRMVEGLAIGPDVGSCGSAAFRNEAVIVKDIATDYRWAGAKELPLGFGLRSCWSVPIRDSNHQVLGTFAMYHRAPASPNARELSVVEAGAHLAGNAIERLTAERKLRESMERLRLAEDAAGFGVWEMDLASAVLTLSAGAAKVSGLGASAVKAGRAQLEALIHPDDRDAVSSAVDQGIQTGQSYQAEFRVVQPNASPRWCRVQGCLDHSTNPPARIIGAIIDITDEKLMLEQLRNSAERMRLAEEVGHFGIWELDLATDTMTLSEGAAAVNGFPRRTFQTSLAELDELVHPSDRVDVDDSRGALLQQGTRELEFRLKLPDGSYRWCRNHAQVEFDGDRPARVIGAILDITQEKKMLEQLRESERQLAHKQKLESIGQLAAGIAHEINTPIQYIGDNGKFLEDAFRDLIKLVKLSPPGAAQSGPETIEESVLDYYRGEVPKAIEQLLEGVDRVASIVRAMKEFSHPGPLERVPVDINRGIESTILVSKHEWKYVADITTDFDRDLPPVPCLAGEFNQVILNLIVNSVHAITDALKDPSDRGSIHISTRQDGDCVEIRVTDTGCGIPEAIQPKVFDPFFTTKPVGKGTGQGLALAHAVIVKKHRGTIRVESKPGRGATFVIRLPLESQLVEV